jgi:hypothetical protein
MKNGTLHAVKVEHGVYFNENELQNVLSKMSVGVKKKPQQ